MLNTCLIHIFAHTAEYAWTENTHSVNYLVLFLDWYFACKWLISIDAPVAVLYYSVNFSSCKNKLEQLKCLEFQLVSVSTSLLSLPSAIAIWIWWFEWVLPCRGVLLTQVFKKKAQWCPVIICISPATNLFCFLFLSS